MKRILIIDDEEDIRDILAEYCKMIGFSPKIASNGEEGLKIFENEDLSLIITDLKMPDMDGYEFVKKVREKDKNIPIAVISGFIDDINKKKIFDCGANFYIEKPFKFNDLKKIFEKITLA